jgi:hypothetical protein
LNRTARSPAPLSAQINPGGRTVVILIPLLDLIAAVKASAGRANSYTDLR